MKKMAIEALYRRPNTSRKHPQHPIFPYLLRGLDITYIPMRKGFVYLAAVLDWATRRVLSWRLPNTLTKDFCLEAVEDALGPSGTPDIFDTDQGCQFTSSDFVELLRAHGIQQMHGRKRSLGRPGGGTATDQVTDAGEQIPEEIRAQDDLARDHAAIARDPPAVDRWGCRDKHGGWFGVWMQ